MDPTSVYGISKLAGERWCEYYAMKYGIDVRSIRYPGLIGYKSAPGGGTTDYAVHIFHAAIEGKDYVSFLQKDTALPMMYMEDAIRATLSLMDAPAENVTIRSSYNLGGISFTPEEIAASIQAFYPDFTCTYEPDARQQIADSWPQSIDDAYAQRDWDWKTQFDLGKMTEDMIFHLKQRLIERNIAE
jgi:nucleoside-diphosphate-sugar epimerase